MEGNLVIVESPAKAKTIQKFLGSDFVVKSSFGHIRDLQEKSLSIDVDHGFTPEYVVPADKKKVVAELKAAAAKAHTVWLASDEDREGEAISWHLADTLGLEPSKTRRIAFHEITKHAIEEAVKNPRSIDMDMVNAQQARRILDRLVGFQLSPVLWRKIKRGLSAGRVQSVALRLIVDREREIAAFQSESSYRVEAVFEAKGNKVKAVLDRTFATKDEARAFLEDCIGANFNIDSVDRKEGNRFPAAPFTTSTLQQEAARKLRLPVRMTMNLAQSLYERGLITYMRTDSTNLSSLALNTAKQFICNNFGEEYSHPRQYKTKTKGAQEAHEAIRPTFIENTSIEGTAQEKKLYELIWKRTVASQMEQARVMNTTIKIASDRRSEHFALKASEVLFDGFLKLYMESSEDEETEDEDVILPALSVGESVSMLKAGADCKYSQPPYRYSQATLIKKLEELEIGRPSTYATIIDTLTRGRSYVLQGDKEGSKVPVTNLSLEKGRISESSKTETIGSEKAKLLPQDVGIIVTDYLVENFSSILEYDFTASVEEDFDLIARGERKWNEVISNFYSPFRTQVDAVMSNGQYSKVERVLGTDPADGKTITAKFGQWGAYVQKGEGEDRQFASLGKGQLIENISLEEAIKLLQLPRNVGSYNGVDIIAMKGRFGPYLKYGDRNITLPKGKDPLKVSLEDCVALIEATAVEKPANQPIKEFKDKDISVLQGRYGPYIKHDGRNYKLPKGAVAEELTEEECVRIVSEGTPTSPGKARRFKKSK
ncbi:MAG: type I DNA topoisomerase [Bacteroidales bacterium]|nr:type I DNA topoisomerase [Candidatus Cryptobacteroides equifaecalis]